MKEFAVKLSLAVLWVPLHFHWVARTVQDSSWDLGLLSVTCLVGLLVCLLLGKVSSSASLWPSLGCGTLMGYLLFSQLWQSLLLRTCCDGEGSWLLGFITYAFLNWPTIVLVRWLVPQQIFALTPGLSGVSHTVESPADGAGLISARPE